MNFKHYKPEKESLGSLVEHRLLALSRRDKQFKSILPDTSALEVEKVSETIKFYNGIVREIEAELEKRSGTKKKNEYKPRELF